jgi:hypothetical protein
VIWKPSHLAWAAAGLLVACASAAAPTALPTLTLNPPTATATVTPVTPSPTPLGLPGPEDLVTPSPESGPVLIPAAAQPLLQRALDDLSARLEVEEDEIQLLRFEQAVWTTLDLGCGETENPISAPLEIDGFRMVLVAAGERYEYHSDLRSSLRLCSEAGSFAGRTEDLLLDTDPVAVEMAALAQRRLAEELDLATRRIHIVDVGFYTWVDSSLGCPQPGQSYPMIQTGGYRIVLAAGDQEYIFHSDTTQVIPCDAAREVLP